MQPRLLPCSPKSAGKTWKSCRLSRGRGLLVSAATLQRLRSRRPLLPSRACFASSRLDADPNRLQGEASGRWAPRTLTLRDRLPLKPSRATPARDIDPQRQETDAPRRRSDLAAHDPAPTCRGYSICAERAALATTIRGGHTSVAGEPPSARPPAIERRSASPSRASIRGADGTYPEEQMAAGRRARRRPERD